MGLIIRQYLPCFRNRLLLAHVILDRGLSLCTMGPYGPILFKKFQGNKLVCHGQRDTYIETHPASQLRRLSESGRQSTRKEIVRKLSRVSFFGVLTFHVERERERVRIFIYFCNC